MRSESLPPTVQPARPDQPFLLAADIDGTLLGDPEGETHMQAFVRHHAASFYLTYVTGRTVASVERLIAEGRLPRPDYICGVVGTELVDTNDAGNGLGQKYASQVASGWDPDLLAILT